MFGNSVLSVLTLRIANDTFQKKDGNESRSMFHRLHSLQKVRVPPSLQVLTPLVGASTPPPQQHLPVSSPAFSVLVIVDVRHIVTHRLFEATFLESGLSKPVRKVGVKLTPLRGEINSGKPIFKAISVSFDSIYN